MREFEAITPFSPLEARLLGSETEGVRAHLAQELSAQREGLGRRIAAKAFNRETYPLAEAYEKALQAALAFLSRIPARP
jgi:hypothetical protein